MQYEQQDREILTQTEARGHTLNEEGEEVSEPGARYVLPETIVQVQQNYEAYSRPQVEQRFIAGRWSQSQYLRSFVEFTSRDFRIDFDRRQRVQQQVMQQIELVETITQMRFPELLARLADKAHLQERYVLVYAEYIRQLSGEAISDFDTDFWYKFNNMTELLAGAMKGCDAVQVAFHQGPFMYEANMCHR